MLELLPFHSICAACCSTDASYKFCDDECVPIGLGRFEKSQRIGQSSTPHLHRTCSRCGYEWLERCLGLGGLEELQAAIEEEADGS